VEVPDARFLIVAERLAFLERRSNACPLSLEVVCVLIK
jgi:hypothetical protein|tara:strand:+ start:615 stop:728 length:114 start_codon:yes stop_codon:yes gene_type:complete